MKGEIIYKLQLYYKDEYIRLFQGDCLEVMDRLIEKGVKFDMILTDPPYGIDLTPQRESGKFKNTKVVNDNNLDWLPKVVKQWKDLLKPDSCAYIFCNWQNYDVFKQEIQKEFIIKNCIVWDKDWLGMGNNWRPNHEFIILATNGKFKTKSNNKTNIIKSRRLSSQKMLHSCEKPQPLLEELIIESCNENDLILDSFVGSGSTLLASRNLHRKCIGIELEEKYCEIAKNRLIA